MWEEVLACETFESLQDLVGQREIPALPTPQSVTITSHRRTVDKTALELMPEEYKNEGLFPSTIYGDGNCLPRCVSLLVYGNEDKHKEI